MASSKASVNLGMRTNNGLRGRQIKEKRKVERETDGRSTPAGSRLYVVVCMADRSMIIMDGLLEVQERKQIQSGGILRNCRSHDFYIVCCRRVNGVVRYSLYGWNTRSSFSLLQSPQHAAARSRLSRA